MDNQLWSTCQPQPARQERRALFPGADGLLFCRGNAPSRSLHRLLGGLVCLVELLRCGPVTAATLLVWPDSPNPAAPYAGWATAAPTIQAAVDAAQPGDTILVTNGVYVTGGRAAYGTMTNRVAVDKPITVQSVNGPAVTVIRGYQVPGTTNGDGAVRCVYLANGAVLSGFTLTKGATRGAGHPTLEMSGGAICCESTNAMVTNCTLTASVAANGGGACAGTLNRCLLRGNWAWNGGGAYSATLCNCALLDNAVSYSGGGACFSVLNNCTLTQNTASTSGGGAYSSSLNNCIVFDNLANTGANHVTSTLN